MGTEVLRPQDFWTDRFRLSPPGIHRRRSYYPNTRPHRKPSVPRSERPEQRRKSPSPSPPLSPTPQPPQSPQPQPQQKQEHISAPIPIPIPRRSPSADELQTNYHKSGAHNQMGRVRILRRGQSLDTIDVSLGGGLMKKNYMEEEDDVYAGSAFFASPAPSSLPLPSFFNNNNNHHTSKIMRNDDDQIHDSATRDLRRLLRLE